jgi:hypothetical protein
MPASGTASGNGSPSHEHAQLQAQEGGTSKAGPAARLRELVGGHPMLWQVADTMRTVCKPLWVQFDVLYR